MQIQCSVAKAKASNHAACCNKKGKEAATHHSFIHSFVHSFIGGKHNSARFAGTNAASGLLRLVRQHGAHGLRSTCRVPLGVWLVAMGI